MSGNTIIHPTGAFDPQAVYDGSQIHTPKSMGFDPRENHHRLRVYECLEETLYSIKRENGYNNTVQMVERQHYDFQDFDFPIIFITASGADYKRYAGANYEVMLNILLVGYIKIEETETDLADQLEKFLKDTVTCLELNPTIQGTVCDLIFENDRTSGEFIYPQAFFALPIIVKYRVNNLACM